MTKKPTDILPAPQEDRELRKTNELIARPLVSGHFTLLGRKVFNAMILHAQMQGAPGKDAPTADAAHARLFWAPLSDIARDARYDSNDTEMLKDVARQLMDIKVENETDTEWTADHLVESVRLVNPAGLRKKGGRIWLGYRFPDEVMHLVTDPRRFTKLPLYYLTILRSNAGAALYEIAKESAWKTSGLTARAPWEDWQAILEGKPKSELQGWKSEYKFFKDRILKKAIAEVGTLTDIEIELLEYKSGRKVNEIQFKVSKKEQGDLPFGPPPVIDYSVVDAVMEFGLTKREGEDIMASMDDGFVRSTCAYVRERLANKNLPAIASAAAFFRSALRGRYVDGVKPKALSKPKAEPTPKGPKVDPETDEARRIARAALSEMDKVAKAELIDRFFAANPALRVVTKGRMTKMMEGMIVGWLAESKETFS
jgi:hypothetical protein